MEEIVPKDPAPHFLHFLHLAKESVTAHVETEALMLLGAGKAAYLVLFFEDDRNEIELGQLIGRGQSSRATSYDNHFLI